MLRKMTRKELIRCFKDYRGQFPDWTVEHAVVLTRATLPVKQSIAFEALSWGAYRPLCSIDVLLNIPGGSCIVQEFLEPPYGYIELPQHERKWQSAVTAMKEQFVPSVCEPLELRSTIECAEQNIAAKGIQNLNVLVGMASLHAFVGDKQRAAHWCERAKKRVASLGRTLADWELRKDAFVDDLRGALETGTERDLLCPKDH